MECSQVQALIGDCQTGLLLEVKAVVVSQTGFQLLVLQKGSAVVQESLRKGSMLVERGFQRDSWALEKGPQMEQV
jgi:hypothetical protein